MKPPAKQLHTRRDLLPRHHAALRQRGIERLHLLRQEMGTGWYKYLECQLVPNLPLKLEPQFHMWYLYLYVMSLFDPFSRVLEVRSWDVLVKLYGMSR